MSLNKQNLNNQIVVMRHNVKWAKFQTISKLAHRVKMMKKRFNPDNKKDKFENKIKKLDEEISTIKDLKEDEISAFSLINTKNSVEVLSNPNSSSKLRALTRLSGHKSVSPIVEMFRLKYPDWKETAPKLLIALKTGAKIKSAKPPPPASTEVKDTYKGKDKRFVLREEHHFGLPENAEDIGDRINENSDSDENSSSDEVDSSLLIKNSPSLKTLYKTNDSIEPIENRSKLDGWLKDENEEKYMSEKSEESMSEKSDESMVENMDEKSDESMDEKSDENMDEKSDESMDEKSDENKSEKSDESMDEKSDESVDERPDESMDERSDEIDEQSIDSGAENCIIIKSLKSTMEEKVSGRNAEDINKADNKLMELKKLIKSDSKINENLVKSILFDENRVSFDKPKKPRKVKSKRIPRSDSSIKDGLDHFQKGNSIENPNVNNKLKLDGSNLDEPKQLTTVDPFFVTQDDKEYLTCAPIVEAPKEINSYNSNQFLGRSKPQDSFLRLDCKQGGNSRPFGLKKRDDYNNSRQPFDSRRKGGHNNSRQPFDRKKRDSYNSSKDSFNWQKKDGFKSRFLQKAGFEPHKRSSGRGNFRNGKPQFKSDRTGTNKKGSLSKGNSETSVEKLHPSWQAKKQQSTIAPFVGKKITFD